MSPKKFCQKIKEIKKKIKNIVIKNLALTIEKSKKLYIIRF